MIENVINSGKNSLIYKGSIFLSFASFLEINRPINTDIDIRNHLRERGVKFIKTWAKLADTSTKRIKNSLINQRIV